MPDANVVEWIREKYTALYDALDERGWRPWAAIEAPWAAIEARSLERAAGVSRNCGFQYREHSDRQRP